MKRNYLHSRLTLSIVLLLFCGLKAAAQRNYFNEFTQLLEQEDTIAAKKLLTDWKKNGTKNGDYYAALANYYWKKGNSSVLSLTTDKPEEGDFLAFEDSTGATAGYIGQAQTYDDKILNKMFATLDEGCKLFPNRLDLAFGKVHIYLELGKGEEAIKTIQQVLEQDKTNHRKWIWLEDKPTPAPAPDFIKDCCQSYFYQLNEFADEKVITELGEELYNYAPTYIPFRTNMAALSFNKGDLKRATELFEAIHKDAPDDLVVTYNLAYSYEKQGKTKEAILLYEQLAKSNNEQYKEIGKKAVKELKDK